MKKYYTLKKPILAILLLLCNYASYAQLMESLNANNINAGIGIGGNLFSMFTDSTTLPTPDTNYYYLNFESPKNSGVRLMFTSALWMSGIDAVSGLVHTAAHRYLQDGRDYYDGPIMANYDTDYLKLFSRVFKITRSEVNTHIALGIPVIPSVMDSAIKFWPAKDNPYIASSYGVNIAQPLAPFTDLNGNEMYEPQLGEYPDICGEEAIFFVYNDERGYHNETQSANRLGVEIRGLAESFTVGSASDADYSKNPTNNTIWVSYELENKSINTYNNFLLTLWEDPDLGCFSNDRVGCDTSRRMMFAHNSTNDVSCNGVTGSFPRRQAIGSIFLNSTINVFGCFTNGAPVYLSDPNSSLEYRNYMMGTWRDGTSFTQGGIGYLTGSPTRILFPGNPQDPLDWSDETSGQSAGDRRMYGSSGPSNFLPGEIKHFDLAFFTSYDSTATNLSIVDTLKRDADILQSFYDQQLVPCKTQQSVSVNDPDATSQIEIFPNPTSNEVVIKSSDLISDITLKNIHGQTFLSYPERGFSVKLHTGELLPGLYIIAVKTKSGERIKKLIKQ